MCPVSGPIECGELAGFSVADAAWGHGFEVEKLGVEVGVEVCALDDAGVFVWDDDFGGYVEPGAGLDFEILGNKGWRGFVTWGVDALGAWAGDDGAGVVFCKDGDMEFVAAEGACGAVDGLDDEGVSIPVGFADVQGGLERLFGDLGAAVGGGGEFQVQVACHAKSDKKVFLAQPGEEFVASDAGFEVGEEEGAVAAHEFGVVGHDVEICADMGSEGDFIDEEEVAVADGGAAFAGDFVSFGDIDDVDEDVHQFGRECGGEVIATAFDEDELEGGEAAVELGHGGVIHAGVVPDGGVRAAAGFDAHDALGGEGVLTDEEFGVFACVDIIGDDSHIEFSTEPLAEAENEHGFTGSDGTSYSETQGFHEIKSRSLASSWRMEAKSRMGSKNPISSLGM